VGDYARPPTVADVGGYASNLPLRRPNALQDAGVLQSNSKRLLTQSWRDLAASPGVKARAAEPVFHQNCLREAKAAAPSCGALSSRVAQLDKANALRLSRRFEGCVQDRASFDSLAA
jgi:hypothetical protein